MKKQIMSILIMLLLCISLSSAVFAADTVYVVDEIGVLTDDEIEDLNGYGAYLADECGVDFLFAFTETDDLDAFVQQLSIGKLTDQVLLVLGENYWDIYTFGTTETVISEEIEYELMNAYQEADTYENGIEAYMEAAANLFRNNTYAGSDVIYGENNTIILDEITRLVDMADVLSDSEESALLYRLDELSERQQVDVVIVTVDRLDGKSHMEYADDFFDYNGYGFGDNRDGILYLVKVDYDGKYSTGNSWISTSGYCITALTDEGIQYIGKQITPELVDCTYADAFDEFIDLADEFITQAKNGEPYDVGNLPKGPFPLTRNFLISLVIGIIIALVGTGIMKGKLKTVRMQSSASNYIKNDSLNVTDMRDIFLYSHVDRREKPKESDSGSSGGSSTHTSSSGGTHGGGGF